MASQPVGGPGWHPSRHWNSVINNVRYIAGNPCNKQPWIYVETAAPALGSMVAQFFSIDPRSIAVGYLHPKYRRGWGRTADGFKDEDHDGRDGFGHRLREEGIPDVNREIGKRLPGADLAHDLMHGLTSHAFLIPFDMVEGALYYFWMADMTKDFIYNWASGIHKLHCGRSGPPKPYGTFYWGIYGSSLTGFMQPGDVQITGSDVLTSNIPRPPTSQNFDWPDGHAHSCIMTYNMSGGKLNGHSASYPTTMEVSWTDVKGKKQKAIVSQTAWSNGDLVQINWLFNVPPCFNCTVTAPQATPGVCVGYDRVMLMNTTDD